MHYRIHTYFFFLALPFSCLSLLTLFSKGVSARLPWFTPSLLV